MSEKRFWFVIDNGNLEYVQDIINDKKITISELEDLLNELSEENRQLKKELKDKDKIIEMYYELNKLKD